jgi:hypothetical protein
VPDLEPLVRRPLDRTWGSDAPRKYWEALPLKKRKKKRPPRIRIWRASQPIKPKWRSPTDLGIADRHAERSGACPCSVASSHLICIWLAKAAEYVVEQQLLAA